MEAIWEDKLAALIEALTEAMAEDMEFNWPCKVLTSAGTLVVGVADVLEDPVALEPEADVLEDPVALEALEALEIMAEAAEA